MHPKVETKKPDFGANRPVAHIISAVRDGYFLTDAAFKRVFLAIYTLSYIWIFLIPADFWDDLAVKNNPDLIKMEYQASLIPDGWFLHGLLSLKYRDFVGHGYVFLLYLAVTLLVRRFVAEFVPASEREKNAIALFTAVLPLYLSRFQLAAAYYCLSLLLFCLGALMLARAIVHSRPALYRVAACACFILAFFTESFVAFYGFVIVLITLSVSRQTDAPTRMARLATAAFAIVRRAPDAIILPFAFFFLKTWLMPTTGPFVIYNAVTWDGLVGALSDLPFTATDSLANATGIGATPLAFGVTLLLTAAGILAIRPTPALPPVETPEQGNAITLLVVFCGLMFAVLPYAVVSRLPSPFDFNDRNQMTMLLVAGAAITYGVTWIIQDRIRWTVIFFLLVWAIATSASTYIAIIRDGHTQNAVVRAISQDKDIRADKALLVDTSQWPNLSRHRDMSTPQLNCLMKQAFGDESHFAAALSYRPFNWKKELAKLTIFRETGTCFRNYPGGKPVLLTISPHNDLTIRSTLRLSVLWLLDANRYQQALDGFASVSVRPVPDGWLTPD